MKVVIYVDGAAVPNPGEAGAGIVMVALDDTGAILKHKAWGAYLGPNTTNNAAEIQAAVIGLSALNKPTEVEIRSDSQYVINTMTKGWSRNKNAALWEALEEAAARHKVAWTWVKGHAADAYNILADKLANTAIERRELVEWPAVSRPQHHI